MQFRQNALLPFLFLWTLSYCWYWRKRKKHCKSVIYEPRAGIALPYYTTYSAAAVTTQAAITAKLPQGLRTPTKSVDREDIYNAPPNGWTSLIGVVPFCASKLIVSRTAPNALILWPIGTGVPAGCLVMIAASQNVCNKPGFLLILSGFAWKFMISNELALGPLSQYFKVLFPVNSDTRRNELSTLIATPTGPVRFLSNTVTWLLLGLYDSNLPVESFVIFSFTIVLCNNLQQF